MWIWMGIFAAICIVIVACGWVLYDLIEKYNNDHNYDMF
jgi:peptidoglycan/LPS O-acetylase OafA/YrhL